MRREISGTAAIGGDRILTGRDGVLTPGTTDALKDGEVVVDERLGGLLRSYRRVA
jgi:hypothetical protein